MTIDSSRVSSALRSKIMSGDARIRLLLCWRRKGFVVERYESAVAFIDAGPPTRGSCIVTDVRMPGMDGIAMLRKLRERNDNRPVIVS